jgi:uncharacterized membrane protein
MEIPLSPDALVTILAAAAITYALRFGGLLLADWLPQTGRFRLFMEALPGTILVSLVAPGILASGWWGCIAAGTTALMTLKTQNVFLAMLAGMLIVALTRLLG